MLPILLGCALLCARPISSYSSVEEDLLRTELADLKQALHATQMELALLDERLQKPVKQEGLDKRLSALEKKLEAVATDLRALSGRLNQTLNQLSSLETSMAECDGRLSEVSKLKGTLTSLSQAMQTPQKSGGESTYLVKSGDSLEKIARAHHMTVNALRQLNQLSSDTIRVGQRLKVSDG